MSLMMDQLTVSEITYLALLLIGSGVGCWLGRTGSRNRFNKDELPFWDITRTEFLFLAWCTLLGAVITTAFVDFIAKRTGSDEPLRQAAGQIAFQLGQIVGLAIGLTCTLKKRFVHLFSQKHSSPVFAGIATFLVAIPITGAVGWLWRGALQSMDFSVEHQRQYDFLTNASSGLTFGLWLIGIVIFAPIAEELVFRAGLFRYFRGRLPRWATLLTPAVVFGFLHVDRKTSNGIAAFGPLVALGLVYAVAYARTGNIAVTIIAHALHNLAMLILFLGGS